MAEKINGWTISQRDGKWQAVNSEGTVGIAHFEHDTVVNFCRRTDPKNYMKK